MRCASGAGWKHGRQSVLLPHVGGPRHRPASRGGVRSGGYPHPRRHVPDNRGQHARDGNGRSPQARRSRRPRSLASRLPADQSGPGSGHSRSADAMAGELERAPGWPDRSPATDHACTEPSQRSRRSPAALLASRQPTAGGALPGYRHLALDRRRHQSRGCQACIRVRPARADCPADFKVGSRQPHPLCVREESPRHRRTPARRVSCAAWSARSCRPRAGPAAR